MKLYFCLAALSVMIVGLAACSDDEPAAEPALIMFYTDN